MKLDDFLEAVLPPEGDYFVEWNTWPGNRHVPKKVKDIAAASVLIRQKSMKGCDVWIAIGSFDGSRQARDCKEKKALYIDIDAGPKKAYSNPKVAATYLFKAVTDGHLPFPTITLFSGHGLHCYWVLDEVIGVPEWKILSRKLKAACSNAGLEVDSKVTTDAARILRPPETKNYKDRTHPKNVKILRHEPRFIYSPAALALVLPAEAATDEEQISANVSSKNPAALAAAVDVEDMINGVDLGPFNSQPEHTRIRLAKDMLDRLKAPRYFEYDQWLKVGAALYDAAGSSMNADTSEWKDLWDGWSQKDPRGKYDHSSIEDKWENELPKMQNVHVASLIYLAAQEGFVFPNAIREVTYPKGYVAVDFGTIRKERDGEEHPTFVMNAHLQDVDIRADKERGYVISARAINPESKRHMDLEVSTLSINNGSCKDEFGRAGITIRSPRQLQEAAMFMESFMEQISRSRGVSDVVNTFGWCKRGGREGFAAGRHVYWDDKSSTESTSISGEMRDLYTPHGGLSSWQNIVQPIVDQNRQPINCMIASSFASPLLSFTSVSGVVLSIHSRDSGTGKTTALSAAQSVWGRPQGGVNSLDDTVNSVTKRLEILQHLPAYWDEVRMRHIVDEFVKLIFQLSQGKGKSRLTSAAKLQHTGTWKTLIGVAGNERLQSHVDRVTADTNAGALRLFEVEVDHVNSPGLVTDNMQTIKALEHNYGSAGAAYAAYLAQHKDWVDNMVQHVMGKFDQQLKATNEERFWLALVAVLYVGAYIATDKVGILRFDLKELRCYLVQAFLAHRRMAAPKGSTNTALRLLTTFLQDRKGFSMTTNIIYMGGRGRPPKVGITWPLTLHEIRHPVDYQKGEDKMLMVRMEALTDWLHKVKGITSDNVVSELKKMGGKVTKATMGAGTTEDSWRGEVLILDLSAGPLASIYQP